MSLSKTIDDIKNVHIQGAENIARAAVLCLKDAVKKSSAKSPVVLYNELQAVRKSLLETRPTEPCMNNALNFIFAGAYKDDVGFLSKNMIERADLVIDFFNKSQQKITEIGSQKIRNGSIIFTHCHSSTVIDILKKAKLQKKAFEVHNTETRPLFQGRITAKELAHLGIPVTMFVDSAGRYALKKADLMLIGADAVTSEGKVINKIGSEFLAEIAFKYEIPVYVCTNSWKFDASSIFGYEKNLEQREENEVWPEHPRGVHINNYAFEKIDPEYITGIISEIGILKPTVFMQEVREKYPWIFKANKNLL